LGCSAVRRWRLVLGGQVFAKVSSQDFSRILPVYPDFGHIGGGVYWKPLYNVLEGEFEIVLVNAQHIKFVPGRKTDVNDAQWIGELLQHGLVRGSFIPPLEQRDVRDLVRYRGQLIQERTREINRVQKVLETANIKLARGQSN
jgi:transposase